MVFSTFFSNSDFPILYRSFLKKLFAIAPPIIIKSIFGIKFVIKSILEEIFDPPTRQATGFLDFENTFSKALTSSIIVDPAYESINFVIE